jgi:hypothetical protein
MQRASITIKIERDGEILAEREFGQDEPNLDDLRDMFMATLFHRIQKLGSDIFDAADDKVKELEEAEQKKKEEADRKKSGEKKEPPAKKKTSAKKKKEGPSEPTAEAADSGAAAGSEGV